MNPSNLNQCYFDQKTERLYLELMKPSKDITKQQIELKKTDLFRKNLSLTFQMEGKKYTIVESWQSEHFTKDKSFQMKFRSPVGSWFIGLAVKNF
jgi:hypothetical protein